MKTKIHLKKLDMRGFSHEIAVVVFAVVFAIIGVAYLVASHADTCQNTAVSGTICCPTGTVVSGTTCYPVSAPTTNTSGEQISIPPERRPVQYVHVCSIGQTTYVTQGTPNCLVNGTFHYNYGPSVPGTLYNTPCFSTNSTSPRFAYISSTAACPVGTIKVRAMDGEQLSQPPARRPVQYLHICTINKITYITQGSPNCLPGGTFHGNYSPSVPGTYYSTPCRTNTGYAYRYAYIAGTSACPVGSVRVSKT